MGLQRSTQVEVTEIHACVLAGASIEAAFSEESFGLHLSQIF